MNIFRILSDIFHRKSTDYIEYELRELENLFAMILFSSLVGYSSPPTLITIRLLPYFKEELERMVVRSYIENDLFGELCGLFDIG